MKRLQGKVIIVTGAGVGLGAGIARVLAREGARVVIAERNAKTGESTAASLRRRGARAIAIRCDVSREEDIAVTVRETVRRYGRIDGLVNNAGVNFIRDSLRVTREEWERILSIDLSGTFFFTQAVMKQMLRQWPVRGSIVNISSVHSFACYPGSAPYDAAKWGVVGLTKAIALEYATKGIRLNVVSPGLINTEIWKEFLAAVDSRAKCLRHWRANIPIQRVIEPEEIAAVCVFLLSDESSCMTGANIFADGGVTSQLVSKGDYKLKQIGTRRK